MNSIKKIFEYSVICIVITAFLVACEKDERPVFTEVTAGTGADRYLKAENNSQYTGVSDTKLVDDTFQVKIVATAPDGNIWDEIIIDRILNGVKISVAADSQPNGTVWTYRDEFIVDSITDVEEYRFTFIDNRKNQFTKPIIITSATLLKDSNNATILSSAGINNSSTNFGYLMGWDLTNEAFINYSRNTGVLGDGDSSDINSDSINFDIISMEPGGVFKGGFQSLNGRLFASAPSTWQIDSITDRDCEAVYNAAIRNNTADTTIAQSAVGDVFVTLLPGNVQYSAIKITEVDKDYSILPCTLPDTTMCVKGRIMFKTRKKLPELTR